MISTAPASGAIGRMRTGGGRGTASETDTPADGRWFAVQPNAAKAAQFRDHAARAACPCHQEPALAPGGAGLEGPLLGHRWRHHHHRQDPSAHRRHRCAGTRPPMGSKLQMGDDPTVQGPNHRRPRSSPNCPTTVSWPNASYQTVATSPPNSSAPASLSIGPLSPAGTHSELEPPDARRKLWRADARQRGRFVPQHDD